MISEHLQLFLLLGVSVFLYLFCVGDFPWSEPPPSTESPSEREARVGYFRIILLLVLILGLLLYGATVVSKIKIPETTTVETLLVKVDKFEKFIDKIDPLIDLLMELLDSLDRPDTPDTPDVPDEPYPDPDVKLFKQAFRKLIRTYNK